MLNRGTLLLSTWPQDTFPPSLTLKASQDDFLMHKTHFWWKMIWYLLFRLLWPASNCFSFSFFLPGPALCNSFHSVEIFFFTSRVWDKWRQMVVQGVTCHDPAACWPLTGRWMLRTSRRRHLGGMWEGKSEDGGGEGLELSASLTAVVPDVSHWQLNGWVDTNLNKWLFNYSVVCRENTEFPVSALILSKVHSQSFLTMLNFGNPLYLFRSCNLF